MPDSSLEEKLESIDIAQDKWTSLEEQQRQWLKEGLIEGVYPIPMLIQKLKELFQYRQALEKARSLNAGAAWKNEFRTFLYGGLFLIAGAYGIQYYFSWKLPTWIFILLALIHFSLFLFKKNSPQGRRFKAYKEKYKALKNLSLPDYVQNYLLPLLGFLKAESKRGQEIQIHANLSFFRPSDHLASPYPENYISPSGYRYLRSSFSKKKWLQFSIRFADKSRLSYCWTEEVESHSFAKNKPKGLKNKQKHRIKVEEDWQLLLAKTKYKIKAANSSVQAPEKSLEVREDAQKYRLRLKKKSKSKDSSWLSPRHHPKLDDFLDALAQLYQSLESV